MLVRILPVLALVVASCAYAAQSQPPDGPSKQPPPDQPDDRAAEHRQEQERILRSIADELKAIREQNAESERATQKDPGGPPIWSNWVPSRFGIVANRCSVAV